MRRICYPASLSQSHREPIIQIPLGYNEALETPKASRSAEALWSFRAASSGRSLILPDGRCDLILRASGGDPDRFIPVVTGPATSAYTVHYDKGDVWYGVRLRPDRALALWGSLIDQAEDQVLRGAAVRQITPKLIGAECGKSPVERLLRSVPDETNRDSSNALNRALDVIHVAGGRIRVEKLAEFSACSSRHLNRLFRRNVGLSVKTYIQLAQFHRTLRLICSKGISLTQAAFEGGYADHAHMTRAFRRFGGFAPTSVPDDLALPAVFLK